MQFKVGFATDIGRKRSQNQDNFAALPAIGLFVVADGMGGHRGGETASAMAVEIIQEQVNRAIRVPNWNTRLALTDAIIAANRNIFQKAVKEAQFQGMGTTTTALIFRDNKLTVGHVGDSRCYYFQPHAIWQITRDHSLVQEKVRAGLISRDEVKNDRMKNVITRSVGFEPEVNVELYEMPVKKGDVFLICSDGLSGLIEDEDIRQLVEAHFAVASNTPEQTQNAAAKLIERANNNGGDDNITLVAVEVTETD